MWFLPEPTAALLLPATALLIVALVVWAGVLVYRQHFSLRSRLRQRLQRSRERRRVSTADTSKREAWREQVLNLPLLDARQRAEVQRKLITAGFRQPQAPVVFMVILLSSAIVLGLAGFWGIGFLTTRLHWMARPGAALVGIYLGLILPRIVLDSLVSRRQAVLQKALPDALDLMIICVNAGLGLNATLQRMARDLRTVSPELAKEFALTSADAQLRGSATVALRLLGERVSLPAIQNLVSTLVMAQRYGTPMAQALRILAESERKSRLLYLEEQAGKLGTKITIPMMLFIMPTVLIVAAGPAIINLMKAF